MAGNFRERKTMSEAKVKTAPTIGRVVLFKHSDSDNDQMHPAIVCFVWSDNLVNLSVSNGNGEKYGITSIEFFHGHVDDCPVNSCCWMPYQQKLAAKVAAEEKMAEDIGAA